jgi:uncharacterized membrane protein YGL010W
MISDEQWQQQQQRAKEKRRFHICCIPSYSFFILLIIVAFILINLIDLEPARLYLKFETILGVKFFLFFVCCFLLWGLLLCISMSYMFCYRDPRQVRVDRERRQNKRLLQKIGGERYVMEVDAADP